MILKKTALAFFMITISFNAYAGIPVNEEMTCQIGGETFEVTSTMSCSSMGRTMSLEPLTSCNFITHVPQCPENKLPMYKEFTTEDLAEIGTFMGTQAYKDAATGSRFYLAALIERELTSRQAVTELMVLQQGFWHTPAQSYNNPTYLAAYHAAASAAFALEDFEDKPFWQGAQAMVYITQDDIKAAKKTIKQMKPTGLDGDSKNYFKSYKAALNYCVRHKDDEDLCSPTSMISAHDK